MFLLLLQETILTEPKVLFEWKLELKELNINIKSWSMKTYTNKETNTHARLWSHRVSTRCRQRLCYVLHTVGDFCFFQHCHATDFQVPTSTLHLLRLRTTIPFLSCRQHSGWREWEKEKRTQERFKAEVRIFTRGDTGWLWGRAAEVMVSRRKGDEAAPFRLLLRFSLLCAAPAVDWRFIERLLGGLAAAFIPIHTPVWLSDRGRPAVLWGKRRKKRFTVSWGGGTRARGRGGGAGFGWELSGLQG